MDFKLLFKTFRKSYSLLGRNNPLILASSTAFFATFSLPPIIIILVSLLGLCFKSEHVSKELFISIKDLLGNNATIQIQAIYNNFVILEGKGWIAAGIFLFFVFSATTLLVIIHDSIHILWRIAHKSTNRMRTRLWERMKAVLLIVSIGVLFLISLLFDMSLALLKEHLPTMFHSNGIFILRIFHVIFSFFVVTTWFSLVFKVLPNAFVPWKIAFAGGFVTGLFFSIGKLILGKFLVNGQIATVFGASGSFALILLFIFYSSLFFYFGACFTYTWGKIIGNPIRPGKYSNLYETTIIS